MSSLLRGAVLGAGLLLAACGQRGALYIPEPRGEAVVQPVASPAPGEDDEARARREATATPAN